MVVHTGQHISLASFPALSLVALLAAVTVSLLEQMDLGPDPICQVPYQQQQRWILKTLALHAVILGTLTRKALLVRPFFVTREQLGLIMVLITISEGTLAVLYICALDYIAEIIILVIFSYWTMSLFCDTYGIRKGQENVPNIL